MAAGAPIECTAVMLDIRKFTKALDAAAAKQEEDFPAFITDFCSTVVLIAQTLSPTVHVASTGDGALLIFTEPGRHARAAFLTALLAEPVLNRLFHSERGVRLFGARAEQKDGYFVSAFGIGIESGKAWKVDAVVAGQVAFSTYLSGAINMAARLEAQCKRFYRAPIIVGLECRKLLDSEYHAAREKSDAAVRKQQDCASNQACVVAAEQDAKTAQAEMDAANIKLGLRYLNELLVDGMETPISAFRATPTFIHAHSSGEIARQVAGNDLSERYDDAVTKLRMRGT